MIAITKTKFGVRALMAVAALGLLASAPVSVHAEEDKSSEYNRILRGLTPAPKPSSRRVERVIVIIDKTPVRIPVDYARAVDLTVFFPHDSSRITRRARFVLDDLARALMSDRLRDHRYLIAGHTNSIGSDAYNLGLSVRRATAVREYLAREYGIRRNRLVVAGWGERRLRNRRNPRSARNRRVEVALVADRSAGYTDEIPMSGACDGGRPTSYTLTFDNFASHEITRIEEYLASFKCYEGYRPMDVSATRSTYWYDTRIEHARLNRNLRLMLETMGIVGQISTTRKGFFIAKVTDR